MNCSASKNLKIYNKIAFVFIWIFLGIGGLCLLAGIIGGIVSLAGFNLGEVWTYAILPIGCVGILLAGLQWVYWAFAKGFERIVEAAEHTIYQVQKNDR